MATGTPGSVARRIEHQVVHYLRLAVDWTMGASTQTLGVVPGGSILLRGGVVVTTAFDFGTNNRLDIGITGALDDFGSDLALGTAGVIDTDEMATAVNGYVAADTTILVTLDLTGTAGTAGVAYVWLEYLPNP